MATQILFGFHAVTVRLKSAPRSVVEVHVDATRRDQRMRQFVERAKEAGARLIDSDDARLQRLAGTHRHQGVVVQAICPQGVRTRMYEESGPLRDVMARDSTLTPEDVAEAVWQALQDDRFLVLPHPEVAGYYAGRAADTDRWLGAMNKLQQRLDPVSTAAPTPAKEI